MEMLIDDRPYTPTSADQTIGELAREICAVAPKDEPRMVVGLRCDGREIMQAELEAVLEQPAGTFGRVEFQTQPVRALVRSSLIAAINVFEQADASREQIADDLAGGRMADAMQKLQQLLSAWKQVQDTLAAAASAIELPLDQLNAGQRAFTDVLEQIRTQLVALRDAMTAADYVLVGDILRYELEEPFADWIQILQAAVQIVESA